MGPAGVSFDTSENTFAGRDAFASGAGYGNAAFGSGALALNAGANGNSAFGAFALQKNISGIYNTAIGASALHNQTVGWRNTAVGWGSLSHVVNGSENVALGNDALNQLTDGSGNIAIGSFTGQALLTGNSNILIGNNLAASNESGKIRIGSGQTATYIAGIYGVTTGAAGAAVVIDANGQLGTVSSSGRYKTDIQPMADSSARLLQLRPVTFRYRQANAAGEQPIQYGLIAEEVAKVYPDLVVYDRNGQVETVAYHLLTPLLLNELQRERQSTEALQRQVAEQSKRIEDQSVQLAALSERMDEVKILKAQIEELKRLAMPVQVAERVQ